MTWFDAILDDAAVRKLADLAAAGGEVSARGLVGSSHVATVAALRRRTQRPVTLVVAHLDDADEAADELDAIGLDATRFPALEVLPGETAVSLDLQAERFAVLRRLQGDRRPDVVVVPVHALMQSAPTAETLARLIRRLEPGGRVQIEELSGWLVEGGYTRVESIETPGEFAVRGGIVDIYLPTGAAVRLDLFGDEIEALYDVALETMGSDRKLDSVELVSAAVAPADETTALADYLPADGLAVLAETVEIQEQGRSYMERASDGTGLLTVADAIRSLQQRCHAVIELNHYSPGASPHRTVELPVAALPTFAESASEAVGELAELAGRCRTTVCCQNAGEVQRLRELLGEFAPDASLMVVEQYVHRGFIWELGDDGLAVVPYHELLHRYQVRRRVRHVAGRVADRRVEMEIGDFVVHRDHGIAVFQGMQRLEKAGAQEEYLTLEFARNAKLHVPASKIELVQKYLGSFKGKPELSTLGGKRWSSQKARVAEAVRDLAGDMLRIQAARAAQPGIRYPADTTWQREFEAEFPYQETEDQVAAIIEVKKDMGDTRPMDRLVCGDVGFGKTEVAIRGAFKAAEFGKQVAVLVPTTVLAEQHERTFRQRFADYPFSIESISRFKTKKQQAEILERLRRGQVDVIIGTHRLLSKDVKFADLGLVVIDEEQRFGVRHKTQLLAFRLTADVLTMSATPIPRTLHMAMLNLRDISSLTTAPLDRRAIVTEVCSWDRRRIQRAIRRELAREGQIFFVHNRVHNIKSVADDIQQLAPEARILVGHGQMPARQLENVMLKFMRREADILVCTTIIESGIDIPTANTMFINSADMFGLSELHQLRGRVGRYKHRAYCYLLLPEHRIVNEVAIKRLKAVEQFSMLGAGFRIALRDLEIRGAGNLLGAEQSGHIAAVGYDMYCRLLEQAVADLRREPQVSSIDTLVELGVTGTLPRGYIPSTARRMEAYRRFSRADSAEALRQVEQDLTSAYGELPGSAVTLLRLAELRVLATRSGVRSITRHEKDVILLAEDPETIRRRLAGAQTTARIVGVADRQGLTPVYFRPPESYFEGDTIVTVLLQKMRPKAPDAETVPASGRGPMNALP